MRKWQCAFVCASFTTVILLSITGRLTRSGYHNEGPTLYRFSQDCQQAISDKSPPYLIYEWYMHALHEQHTGYECEQLKIPHVESAWISEEEQQFPIAYAITTYESFTRLARLLRMIHRNHNVYCIHVDAKAPKDFVQKVKYLAQCFGNNVILVPDEQRVDVRWGYFSVLQSTLVCSELLLKNQVVDWRYMLNINEKEFPLRTNWELVSSLKALNGSNMIEGLPGYKYSDRFPNSNFSFKRALVFGACVLCILVTNFNVRFIFHRRHAC
ncbi:N-acetyllactosaminide beta-1 6-N-acetylglucosaminyl-transferase [Paragonimus heterotremus]|uniref:N-acetyllactosaminide beta-1 6-N-acetylglucosaminyl-transferase n=1 Tax=Paragonimus heterotremus TaxID=100268 RepID=A0A8J4T0X6_9TREM|nr:N-acetyllactosaminide beta-1 6-N-acetylglucosaminyl-transferase [Paragonimus heterotremus]